MKAKLPSIFYNRSIADVLELIGNTVKTANTPELMEYNVTSRF
jgi:hypothetical protein